MPIASYEVLDRLLAPLRGVLEGAGLAAEPEHWPSLAARLEASGVHLVSRLGDMQRPPLGWRQSGRARLADWVGGDAP
jgi:hypothetical protein